MLKEVISSRKIKFNSGSTVRNGDIIDMIIHVKIVIYLYGGGRKKCVNVRGREYKSEIIFYSRVSINNIHN